MFKSQLVIGYYLGKLESLGQLEIKRNDMKDKAVHWKEFVHANEGIILIMILVVVLRIPNLFEPYWYGDEGIYLAVGQAMRHGITLYKEIIDHKTPLIYYWSALAYSLVWLKVFLMSLSLIALGFFYALTLRFFDSRRLGLVVTLVYALLTTLPALEGNIANGELFLMPFILAGMWWLWRRWPIEESLRPWQKFMREWPWWQPVVAGSLFSLALLTKVPAGFDMVAVGIFWLFLLPLHLRGNLGRRWLTYGVWLVAGFLLPIFLSLGYFASQGYLRSYLQFGLLYNFRYIEAWGTPFTNPVGIFLASMTGRSGVLVVTLLGLWLVKSKLRLPVLFTFIWLALTLFAALLSLRPYPHYFIQIVPPVSLLLGFLVSEKRYVKGVIVGVGIGIWLIFLALGFKKYPTVAYYTRFLTYLTHQMDEQTYQAAFDSKAPNTYAVAEWLRAHTTKDERVFIWGDEPMVYALSRRSPVGRFTVAFHIASFQAWEETMTALEKDPPTYIVNYLPTSDIFPAFYTYVANNYIPIENIGRAVIFRRVKGMLE